MVTKLPLGGVGTTHTEKARQTSPQLVPHWSCGSYLPQCGCEPPRTDRRGLAQSVLRRAEVRNDIYRLRVSVATAGLWFQADPQRHILEAPGFAAH